MSHLIVMIWINLGGDKQHAALCAVAMCKYCQSGYIKYRYIRWVPILAQIVMIFHLIREGIAIIIMPYCKSVRWFAINV